MTVYEIHKDGCTYCDDYEKDDYADRVVYIAANRDVANSLVKKIAADFLVKMASVSCEVWSYEVCEKYGLMRVTSESESQDGARMKFYAKEVVVKDHIDEPVDIPTIEILQKLQKESIEHSKEEIEAYIRKMDAEVAKMEVTE